jgi:hypothetical protein
MNLLQRFGFGHFCHIKYSLGKPKEPILMAWLGTVRPQQHEEANTQGWTQSAQKN